MALSGGTVWGREGAKPASTAQRGLCQSRSLVPMTPRSPLCVFCLWATEAHPACRCILKGPSPPRFSRARTFVWSVSTRTEFEH